MAKRRSSGDARSARATTPRSLELIALTGLPEIHKGDALSHLITQAARKARLPFRSKDILVIAQKIVSKAEGRLARLAEITASSRAIKIAAKLKKDSRLVEVILRESRRIVRSHPVLITETHHGFVCANAGVDHSNVPGKDVVSLLPCDPDRSARKLATELQKATGKKLAVIISDTFGRPWRLGLANVAIGAAGLPVLLDLRGTPDRNAKPLQATVLAVADELAAAAGLLMGKSEGIPVVIIRGFRYAGVSQPAAGIIRPAHEDLFR